MYIVNSLTTKEERNELLKSFQQLDSNGDGVLSREELLIGYKKIMGATEAEEEVNKIMAQVDKNNSGSIDYSGRGSVWGSVFRVRGCVDQPAAGVVAEAAGDCVQDDRQGREWGSDNGQDGSGALTVDELKELFGGGRVPEDLWQQIIKEVDNNGDGQISLQEFKEMMLKLQVD